MPRPIVECVPNFSEGRRPDVLDALAAGIRGPGVRLLDVSADPDHNRAVFTFVGEGEAVLEAAFRSVAVAVERIDLRAHQGVHPRIGAVDVIPFVPLRGARMADAVRAAHALGPALAGEVGVPVFYYGEAALRPERRELAALRRGQFEELAARMRVPGGAPDAGPPVPHPRAGATAIGARAVLIAMNAVLDS